MPSRFRRGTATPAALLTLALAAACGDNPSAPTPQPTAPVTVASVEVTPGSLVLQVDGTRALSATIRSRSGAEITRPVQWTSSDPATVRVDESGNVTALQVGTAVITAASEGRQGQATVEVAPPPPPPAVAYVVVTGGAGEMEPGEGRQLGVTLLAADGTVLADRAVTWATSDSTVVLVRPNGSVYGMRGGTATITATSEGKTGQTTITIPDWLRFNLQSLDGQALPAVIATTADTTAANEHGTTVTVRRVRVQAGLLWLSTRDWTYRQLYTLQTWEHTVTYFNGNSIIGAETLVGEREIRDEGVATQWNMFSGEPIYESILFAGHQFTPTRIGTRSRAARQAIPGTGTAEHNLVYTR